MNGKKAKALRRKVYGQKGRKVDYQVMAAGPFSGPTTINQTGLQLVDVGNRLDYQEIKRHAR